MEQFGGDRLAVGHPGAADRVHGFVRAGLQGGGDGRGRDRRGAVDGLPGVVPGRAGPGVLLGADGDPDARRRHGRPDTAAALERRPSSSSCSRAWRRVARATPKRAASSRSLGRISPTENSESSASVRTVLRCQYFGSGTDSSCVVPTLSSAIAGVPAAF
ncbi:hypothetical protein SGLAM104S_01690 [Streptomyces glaucescens]